MTAIVARAPVTSFRFCFFITDIVNLRLIHQVLKVAASSAPATSNNIVNDLSILRFAEEISLAFTTWEKSGDLPTDSALQVPHIKKRDIQRMSLFLVGEAGLEPARPQ